MRRASTALFLLAGFLLVYPCAPLACYSAVCCLPKPMYPLIVALPHLNFRTLGVYF